MTDLDTTIDPAPAIDAAVVPGAALPAALVAAPALAATVEPEDPLAAQVSAAPALAPLVVAAQQLTVSVQSPALVPLMAAFQPPYYVAPEELDPMEARRLLVADAIDIYSPGGDNTWYDLAEQQAALQPLALLDHGILAWRIAGMLEAPSSGNTLEVQLLVDGLPAGPILSFGTIGPFAGTARMLLDFELDVLGDPAGQPFQLLRANLDLFKDDGTSLFDQKRRGVTQLDETAGHRIGLRVRKSLATASHTFTLRSLQGFHDAPRSMQ